VQHPPIDDFIIAATEHGRAFLGMGCVSNVIAAATALMSRAAMRSLGNVIIVVTARG
jgi:hypothetical protein